MPAQQLLPGVVTHGLGEPRRVHDVGEEEGPQGSRRGLGSWRSDVEVDDGADLLQGSCRGLDLEACPGVVAVGGQGPSEPDPCLGGFVRSVDLAPGADALPERGDGLLGVTAIERQLATRHRGCGRRPGRPEPARELLELGDAGVRRGLVADRQARSHVHREHEHPPFPSEHAPVGEGPGEAPHCRRARRPAPTASGLAPAGRRHRTPRPAASASSAPARSPRLTRMSTSSL